MTTQLDTNPALALLDRTNAIAKARKLAINAILSECRNASSVQALCVNIDRIVYECDKAEAQAMINGTWIVKTTKIVWGRPSTSTYARPDTKAQADLAAAEALRNGHFDIEVYFHQYDEIETGPVYGSFFEALEYQK